MNPTDSPHVAIIGAGPSGLFTALTLLDSRPEIRVTIFDRIAKPFGLLRYGVAPDHTSFRKIQERLQAVLDHPNVTFEGGVRLGADLAREELKQRFDAVVYATGAPLDVDLDVPGDDLPGSLVSGEVIRWYTGHPEARDISLDGVNAAAVVGLGNVAMDLARLLAAPAGHLDGTVAPEGASRTLGESGVKEVWILGRRGPQHAAFTTPELREIVALPGVRTVLHGVSAAEIAEAAEAPELERRVKGNLAVMAGLPTDDDPAVGTEEVRCTVHFKIWTRPVEVLGEGSVRALRVEGTHLVDGRVKGTGETRELPVQLVVAAIGYRGAPIEGLPFNEASGIIHNLDGQMCNEAGEPLPGEFVAGWAKRGATGIIGNAKSDGVDAAKLVLAHLDGAPPRGVATL